MDAQKWAYTVLETLQVIFTARYNLASSVRDDIALDDIELTPGKCEDTKRDVTRLCSFDDYDCGYAASSTGSLNWEWKSLGRATSSFGKQPDNDHTLGTSVGLLDDWVRDGFYGQVTHSHVHVSRIGYWIDVRWNLWSALPHMIQAVPVHKTEADLNTPFLHYIVEGSGTEGNVKEAYLSVNFPGFRAGLSCHV
ncbi:hypothetical protein AVEN_113930-1 [Araneus ventricosus]|uniref:MAM domain-containing protein n=1 Tax=Araneus ventricosus TaxID=182803 RepID=A0A4Y2W066_ARAVE|nr:hypothetical protein AVEN_113930-1 [Araneus ventricosus]